MGVMPLVPPSLCTIAPGWAQIHKVEATATGADKFTRQTCVVRDPLGPRACSMFIPSGVTPTENKVHIFFAANSVEGDVSNAVTCHALRAAVASTDWILIAVTGSRGDTVTGDEVLKFLDAHGRPKRVDKLRLSCHSRGKGNLVTALTSGKLVAKSGSATVFPASIVERVVTFDADEANNLTPAVTAAGIPSANLFGFQVIAKDWHIRQTVAVTNFAHGALCLNAVVWARMIEDARVVQPTVVIPPDINKMVTDLGLPALGLLTSRRSPTAPFQNFEAFCKSKTPLILSRAFDTNKLGAFVLSSNLTRVSPPFNGAHHLHVAEFAHEVTDALPPQP